MTLNPNVSAVQSVGKLSERIKACKIRHQCLVVIVAYSFRCSTLLGPTVDASSQVGMWLSERSRTGSDRATERAPSGCPTEILPTTTIRERYAQLYTHSIQKM